MIEVKNLTKKFPVSRKEYLVAVDNVSFQVEKGEIFGLLGPNGAGKTTCLEIIEGVQKPTSGETLIDGLETHKHPDEIKQKIGIQLQASSYFDHLTLGEIINLFASFYHKEVEVDRLLEIVGLKDRKKSLVRQLSGGQKQRFSICATLVNDPEIVFLDEPTTGLDPQARRNIWDFISKINQEGKTIVLTTHYMEEAQTLCDRVGIMDLGKIVALDTPLNLINKLRAAAIINFHTDREFPIFELQKIEGVYEVEHLGNHSYHLHAGKGVEVLPKINALAKKKNIKIEDEEVLHATLEDVFLELTGKALKE